MGRDTHVAVGVLERVAPVDDIGGGCFKPAAHTAVCDVGQRVGAGDGVIAATHSEPQIERVAQLVALHVDVGIAQQFAVNRHLLKQL